MVVFINLATETKKSIIVIKRAWVLPWRQLDSILRALHWEPPRWSLKAFYKYLLSTYYWLGIFTYGFSGLSKHMHTPCHGANALVGEDRH